MTNFVKRILTKLDIFGSNVGLNYNKNNMFQTSIGGILSICFCVLIGVFFWSNILAFLRKDQVFSNTVKTYWTNPSPINLNANKFMFAVKIQQTNFIGQPYLNISLQTRDYENFENGTQIQNKFNQFLEPCTLEHFSQLPSHGINWTETFFKINFTDFLCPQLNYNFTLGGNYNSPNFYHWKITVSKCQNNSLPDALWKPKCAPQDIINNYFQQNQNVRLQIYTTNFIMNPLQSTDYVTSFIEDSIIFSIQQNVAYTTADIFFTESTVSTDQSLIPFKDIQNEQYLTYSFGNLRQQYVIGNQSTVFGDFYIRKDNMAYTYNRYFLKVGDILSYIGGFTQVFILVTAIIVNYYNDYMYSISLANKIYDFEFELDKDAEIDKNKKQNNRGTIKGLKDKKSAFYGKSKMGQVQVIEEKQENEVDISDTSSIKNHHNQNKELKPDIDKFKQIQTQANSEQIKIEIPTVNAKQDKPNNEIFQDRKKKNKKITKREDDGLLPLDKLKQIIEQRANYISSKQSQKIKEEDEVSICQNDIKESQIVEQRNKQYTHQFFENVVKSDFQQLEQKDNVMNESVIPESPNPQDVKQKKNIFSNDCIKADDIQKPNEKQKTQDEIQLQSQKIIQEANTNQQDNTYLKQQQSWQKIYSTNQINHINPLSSQSINSPQNNQNKQLFDGLGFRNKQQFLKKEFEFLLKRQRGITMTLKFFLYKLSCEKFFKTEQVLLLDKAEKQLKNDLDIFMILNRIKELEKFKSLFLDRNQEILFNFFPKPIISIKNSNSILSYAEMTELMKEQKYQRQKSIKVNTTYMKKMKLKFKTALLVTKAIQLFKRPLNRKIDKFDSLNAYQKLYDAYEQVRSQGINNKINTKLIELLGEEMNKILNIASLLEVKNFKKPETQTLIQENFNLPMNSNSMRQLFPQVSPRIDSYRSYSFQQKQGEQFLSAECLNENKQYLIYNYPSQE
ncbi:transmembrane protein, putative (macronuclear) [Tetrahymena thermophila SB210]|uniref:Transmembrane protein, putative n=1 Tax=Tetrahymena thermophila (strain SB210) TaxID=312017 RepID=Q245U0_TETTS|nr:transmembrane protein, putative [Tetrahymena thermophila SB210]EAS03543.2 transmembrane protein, putative [Tetrahymena thermophila SB210]|eukprot:XP_001023788.2 transmembrane protein, putative [Tetrahymena thermophila SB210]